MIDADIVAFVFSLMVVHLFGCFIGYSDGYKAGCDETRRLEFSAWNRHFKRFKCTPRDGVLIVRLDLQKSDSHPEGS